MPEYLLKSQGLYSKSIHYEKYSRSPSASKRPRLPAQNFALSSVIDRELDGRAWNLTLENIAETWRNISVLTIVHEQLDIINPLPTDDA